MTVPLLAPPTSSAANPGGSIASFWRYLEPAVDHLVKSPIEDGKLPSVDMTYHMGVYTHCYNLITSTNNSHPEENRNHHGRIPPGLQIYHSLDQYYIIAVREIHLGAPEYDDETLIEYVVAAVQRFQVGVEAVSRLLNYINRTAIKSAIDEGRGWCQVKRTTDKFERPNEEALSEDEIAHLLEITGVSRYDYDSGSYERRLMLKHRCAELLRWGYAGSNSSLNRAEVEANIEAESDPHRIIHLASLGYRRLRTELIEPLLRNPDDASGGGGGIKAEPVSSSNPLPRGRIGKAVKALLETRPVDVAERQRLITGLAYSLRIAGIKPEYGLRKKLEKLAKASA